MIALLSARALSWLSGPLAQAIGVAVVVTAVIGSLWWLRHDARMDERRTWEVRQANAKAQDDARSKLRERKAAEIARKNVEEMATALALSEASRLEAEQTLSSRARAVAYPKDIIKALNR